MPSTKQIQKSAQHYTEAARDEVTLLTQIRDGDPNDERHCVRLLDHFEHMGPHGRHVCMVFEVLGDNLLALIKRYDYKGVPVAVVRNLAQQMLLGLDYLHRWGTLQQRQQNSSSSDSSSSNSSSSYRSSSSGHASAAACATALASAKIVRPFERNSL